MPQLSELAALFKKMQGAQNQQGQMGARTSPRPTAQRGFARGTSGVLGSKTFQGRNSQAGEQKEMEMLKSPIFQAFLKRSAMRTPITDFFAGRMY